MKSCHCHATAIKLLWHLGHSQLLPLPPSQGVAVWRDGDGVRAAAKVTMPNPPRHPGTGVAPIR
jgi:hypothetical protein